MVDESDEDRATKIGAYLRCAEPSISLVRQLAVWSDLGMHAEVASVFDISPDFVRNVAEFALSGDDAARLDGQMQRLGMPGTCPVPDPADVAAISRSRQVWSNYRGVRRLTEALRQQVLDQGIVVGAFRARHAAADCVLELSGAHWAHTFEQLELAVQAVIGKMLKSERIPDDSRERLAYELLRTNWVAPPHPDLVARASDAILRVRVRKALDSGKSADLKSIGESLRLWYLAIDELDGDFGRSSPQAEAALVPLVSAASAMESVVRQEILRIEELQAVVKAAEATSADRLTRSGAARRAREICARASPFGANTPTVEALAARAQVPWTRQKSSIRTSVGLAVAVIAVIAVVLLIAFGR